MKCQKNRFKDKCDMCGNFDYLRGYERKCLCQSCITFSKLNIESKKKLNQLTIFDMEETNIDKRKKNNYIRSSKQNQKT